MNTKTNHLKSHEKKNKVDPVLLEQPTQIEYKMDTDGPSVSKVINYPKDVDSDYGLRSKKPKSEPESREFIYKSICQFCNVPVSNSVYHIVAHLLKCHTDIVSIASCYCQLCGSTIHQNTAKILEHLSKHANKVRKLISYCRLCNPFPGGD